VTVFPGRAMPSWAGAHSPVAAGFGDSTPGAQRQGCRTARNIAKWVAL